MAKWLDMVRKAAPGVASLIGGPGGLALRMLSQAFLGKDDGSEDEVGAAVLNDPEAAVKLRQVAADLEAKKLEAHQRLVELGIQLEQVEAGDRANARAREIALKDWTHKALALGTFVLFAAVIGLAHYHALPPENRELAIPLLEIVKMAVILVLGYYFGSSTGSAAKTLLGPSGGGK